MRTDHGPIVGLQLFSMSARSVHLVSLHLTDRPTHRHHFIPFRSVSVLMEPPAAIPAYVPGGPIHSIMVLLDLVHRAIGTCLALADEDSVTRNDELAKDFATHIPVSTPTPSILFLHPSTTWESVILVARMPTRGCLTNSTI